LVFGGEFFFELHALGGKFVDGLFVLLDHGLVALLGFRFRLGGRGLVLIFVGLTLAV
jgi:hypothetical protein